MSDKKKVTPINRTDTTGALSSGKASLFVLAAGCMWGLMGLLVRSLGTVGIAAMEVCFIRSMVTVVSLLLGILLFQPGALKIKWKDIWCFIGTGACSVTFFNFCYFKTMTLTSLSVAAVLLYTAPAFVMLMSAVLFSEKLSFQKLAALVLAFAGCAFVSGIAGGAGRLSLQGIIYGLLSGFGYALYSIFGRYALEKGYSSLTISFYTFLCSGACTFFLADKGSVVDALWGNTSLICRTVILVLLVTLLPYLSYTRGLKGMENGTASVLASIEPVVATLIGVFVYKESLNIWNIIGMCMVLGSIILINMKYSKNGLIKKFTKK